MPAIEIKPSIVLELSDLMLSIAGFSGQSPTHQSDDPDLGANNYY